MKPNLNEEKYLWNRGYEIVVGLDEAGRGPLAGPVVAGAIAIKNPKHQVPITNQFLKSQFLKNTKKPFNNFKFGYSGLNGHCDLVISYLLENVKDSKQLSSKKREEIYKSLIKCSQIEWGVGIVSEKIIDKINIKNASELAMEKALGNLILKSAKRKIKPDFLLIDGIHISNSKLKTYNLKLIPRGDSKVFSIAAASIIAKVTRDRIMLKLHKKYPQYGFDIHKGYGTKYHMDMIKKYGPCKIHRKSFEPIKGLLVPLAKS